MDDVKAAEVLPAAGENRVKRLLSGFLALRRLLALPAVFIALYAEQLIEQARSKSALPPLLGWQLFAVAGLLLAISTLPVKLLLPVAPSSFLHNLRSKSPRARKLFLGLLIGAVACSAAVAPLFFILNSQLYDNPKTPAPPWPVNTGSWLLFAMSLLLFGSAFVVWERTTPSEAKEEANWNSGDLLPRRFELVLMVGLFVGALMLRLYNLDSVPPGMWFDEAQNGLVAERLLSPGAAHVTYIGDRYTQMGTLDLYFMGTLIKIFGNAIWPVRLMAALSGSLSIPLLYLLTSRIYGWRSGLAAAVLTGVSAWHITFSRFASGPLMVTVAYDVAGYLCIAQALRTGRLGYYAAGGILFGLGLHGYYPAKFAFIVLTVIPIHQLITFRMRLIKALRAGLVVFVAAVALAFMPVGLFAVQQPEAYASRVDTVSIFNPFGSSGDPHALEDSIRRHLLMFNWEGDHNGRHNLSGQPVLDWITAALFFGGLAACALRAWRWQYLFPLIWFSTSITGGVVALLFEAPQAARTVENSLVTTFIAGIFLGEATQVWLGPSLVNWLSGLVTALRKSAVERTRKVVGPVAAVVSIIILLAVGALVASITIPRYFVAQAGDPVTWRAMFTPQEHAARVANQYGADYDIYVVPIYWHLPTSDYLAPNVEAKTWPGMQAFPLATTKPGGAVLMLDPPAADDIADIARIYPNAHFEILSAPDGNDPLLYTIRIPAQDINSLHGVRATLFADNSSTPLTTTTVSQFSYNWSSSKSGADKVRLASTVRVDQFGNYAFDLRSASGQPNAAKLSVDGRDLSASQPIILESGLHSIIVTDQAQGGTGVTQLLWKPFGSASGPITATNLFDPQDIQPHGLRGVYRPGAGFDASPVMEKIDPFISFYFQETPLPRPYSIEWTGSIYIPQGGSYTFSTKQLSKSQLFIDGSQIIDNEVDNKLVESQLTLTEGWHSIRMLYQDLAPYSNVSLSWTPPGGKPGVIPTTFLRPQQGQTTDTIEAETLPTLAEAEGSYLPPDKVSWYPPRTP